MKTTYVRSLTVIALFTLCAALARADSATLPQILKDRESVLSQILNEQENRRASGHSDEEAIFSAQVSLYSFRRDTAKTSADKAKHQLMIVAAHEKRLATIKGKAQVGGVANLDVLRATDGILQARQVLEEIRVQERKG